ncbi:MAG: gliding motility-associated C-terminal domain-containing protein [Saprospiraceae bacterium]|nr:gliding motility-associated C-terminal domain-containing protein [Saprospiraceae bacterium]
MFRYFRLFFPLILLLANVAVLEAKHIIGGDLRYECLGDGLYRITMYLYRDCRPQEMAAGFDGESDGTAGAFIAVYRGTRLVDQLTIKLKNKRYIDPPDYPCLIPPDNLCVEEGVYEWEYQMEIWPSPESYHFVYQRCCRNNTINNIRTPGDVGATYAIEVTPEAQATCNNSPVFNSFPPTVVCVSNDVNFDHSAFDQEGDSLVYSFCFPLKGGGLRGLGQNNPGAGECDGIRPYPPCAPPFAPVSFSTGYSYSAPMAGDPVVKIDNRSGLISGSPQVIGQYVLAVCVQEFRQGVLIGEIRRDFQFNVADCDPTVFAKVKSDAQLGQKEYVINSCGNNTILFENESILEQYIDTYRWEFNINGNNTVVSSRDAEITFPGIGTYRGLMMVNPGLDCGDTAEIYVNLYPSITADFEFDYDTCKAGTTVFTDKSFTGAERIESWHWEFGEGGNSDEQNPRYDYPIPGLHRVALTVTDNNLCQETKIIPLPYYPVPALVVVDPSSFVGCSPADIFFDNLSAPIDSTYTTEWDFGDGNTSFEISPFHQFIDPGVYSVSVQITSPIGCYTSANFPNWIEIKESPSANFSFLPDQPSNFNPTVDFTNLSSNFIRQQWIFGDAGRSLERDPRFTFPDTGTYQVDLIAIHANGCKDTASALIDVLPRVTYYMPNAFTPNGDGKNDFFIGTGYTDGMRDFELTIWSRWGELLFKTEDPGEGWDGTKQNTGEDLAVGVYVYQVKYTDPRGNPNEFNGFATLVR